MLTTLGRLFNKAVDVEGFRDLKIGTKKPQCAYCGFKGGDDEMYQLEGRGQIQDVCIFCKERV